MTKQEEMKSKTKSTRFKERARRRRRGQIASLVIGFIGVAIFGLALSTLLSPVNAQAPEETTAESVPGGPAVDTTTGAVGNTDTGSATDAATGNPDPDKAEEENTTDSAYPYWRRGYEGHGTTHEQLGQPHWPSARYTVYVSTVKYHHSIPVTNKAMKPVYNFSQTVFETLVGNTTLPKGYIAVKDDNTLALGPKVENNDWRELLSHYWLLFFAMLLLATLIIVMPFIAICYCCFCCCRCRQGCRPCEQKKDARLRLCLGLLLLLCIIGIILGIVIALVTNKQLEKGLRQTSITVKEGSEDTCAFLKDVAEHIYHLFVNNYQEMETNLIKSLNEAHKHILLDLFDVSGIGAIEEMLRILNNMPEAVKLMVDLERNVENARFYGAQLRDGIRGVKREVNEETFLLCDMVDCTTWLKECDINLIDMSRCLHYDMMPNTTEYIEAMEWIVLHRAVEVPKTALGRLKSIADKIKAQTDKIIPTYVHDIIRGRDDFHVHANNARNLIDAVISDIHFNTLHSTRSFEDLYGKFGNERYIFNIVVCIILIIISFVLIVGLLFGCCGKQPSGYRDPCCNKATGASCLLLAIILMFIFFSVLTLIGFFYFIIGLVTYHGACLPLKQPNQNAIFQELDSSIDLNQYLPNDGEMNPRMEASPLRMSSAISSCEGNETIFKFLRDNNLYDINILERIKVLTQDTNMDMFTDDLADLLILKDPDRELLAKLRTGNLSGYHSALYTEPLCLPLTPVKITDLARKLRSYANAKGADSNFRYYWVNFHNQASHLETYHHKFEVPLVKIVKKVERLVEQIDSLILYENNNFTRSMQILSDQILEAENYIKERGRAFLNAVGKNLTNHCQQSIDEYIRYVIMEANKKVGHCQPLSYIYYRGVDLICYRMIDPLNGFWVGLFLSTVLFLPAIFLSHKLMCLYKKRVPYRAPPLVEGGCPICTGAPYVPPPIITCGGGQQDYCGCGSIAHSRGGGGTVAHINIIHPSANLEVEVDKKTQPTSLQSSDIEHEPTPTRSPRPTPRSTPNIGQHINRKRKQD